MARKRPKNVPVTQRQREVLYGTLLGDGSLKQQTNYVNLRFQMRHSIVQTQWFFWKVMELQSLATEKAVHPQPPDGYSSKEKLHFQTRALPSFTEVHHQLYTDNVLDFTKPWLSWLTPLSLMVWVLDDGGRMGEGGRKLKLCTHGFFSEDAQILLCQALKANWDIDSKVEPIDDIDDTGKIMKTYKVIMVYQNAFKKLARIIMPYIPVEDMVYKVFMSYEDAKLQQSWIAEMKSAMPQFSNKIDELFAADQQRKIDALLEADFRAMQAEASSKKNTKKRQSDFCAIQQMI
jgi:hypothetical protein